MISFSTYDDESILNDINILITKLESNEINTNNIDSVYQDWCEIVTENMLTSIPHKVIANNICMSSGFRKHRMGKPWWSNFLTDLWSKLCTAEKKWLHCSIRNLKVILKSDYVKLRKHFDSEVQKAKRQYWYNMQDKVILDNGTVSTSISEVLNRWKHDFSSLLLIEVLKICLMIIITILITTITMQLLIILFL